MTGQDDKNNSNLGQKPIYFPTLNLEKSSKVAEDIHELFEKFMKLGILNEEIKRKDLKAYFYKIKNKAIEFNDDAKMLVFLLSEKNKNNDKIIQAKIEKNDLDRKYCESLLKIIIDPYIEDTKSRILLRETVPGLKGIKAPEKSLNDEYENRKIQNDALIPDKTSENQDSSSSGKEISIKLPDEFQQIKCKANKNEIIDFFMRLANKKNEIYNKPYLEEAEVMKLLDKNFKIFNQTPIGLYFPLNLTRRQKGRLSLFMYQFYNRYSYNLQDKDRYAYFLIHNFELFKDDSLKYVKQCMCTSKKPIENHRI
jgi:hypothetical protein